MSLASGKRAKLLRRVCALREANILLNNVIDGTSDIVYAKDLQHRYLVCNQAGADLLQKRKEEVIGNDDLTLFAPEQAAAFMANDRALTATGTPWSIVDERVTIHGEERIMSANKSVFRDASGKIAGIIGISRDVTDVRRTAIELQRAKEAAEAGERAKSEFVAAISHEIRTPMNGILGMADLLDTTRLSAEQREMVNVMRRSGAHLLVVVNDILELSKLASGKVRLHVAPFELDTLVRDAAALFEIDAQRKGVFLTMDLDRSLNGKLLGDADRIRQILINLLGNAVKFTERGGVRLITKRLRSSRGHTSFRVAVCDSGIGIERAARATLFQPFQQAEHGDQRRYGGTGLGLAISAKIAEALGCRIRVRSRVGQGSAFWFRLTLPDAEPKDLPRQRAAYRSLRVLLAEDNRMMLEHAGHTVRVVDTGAQALEALRDERFDCVLMDCQMPVLDGYEATRRLREHAAGPLNADVPVLALTASGMPGDRDRCLLAGMSDLVLKPLNRRILEDAFLRCGLVLRPWSVSGG